MIGPLKSDFKKRVQYSKENTTMIIQIVAEAGAVLLEIQRIRPLACGM